ncbi:hypothetical protein N9V68_01155 [Octadecabacter sp.]|nr:hypothetical protein [Octadecabacter sp.]
MIVRTTIAAFACISLISCGGENPNTSNGRSNSITALDTPVVTRDTVNYVRNPLGITGVVNARDARSLRASLDGMTAGLSQQQELAFMEAFFRVAYTDRCDITGQLGESGNSFNGGRRSTSSCFDSGATFGWAAGHADTYVADGRMDGDYPRTVTSLAAGTRTRGTSTQQSYVNFIRIFGPYVNGRSADYILQRNANILSRHAVSFR